MVIHGSTRASQNWLLDLGYVGAKGTRLFATEQLNPLVPASLRASAPASAPQQGRVDPLQGSRSIRTNGGSSNYNSFQAEVKRRFAKGFQFNSSYTWSKAIDNVSELFNYGNTASLALWAVPGYYGGARLDRAVSSFDRPHRWVFSYVYELPWMKQQRNLLGYVVGGWQVSGLTAYESGNPYTITNGQDSDGLEGNDRPDFNPLGRPGVRPVPTGLSHRIRQSRRYRWKRQSHPNQSPGGALSSACRRILTRRRSARLVISAATQSARRD